MRHRRFPKLKVHASPHATSSVGLGSSDAYPREVKEWHSHENEDQRRIYFCDTRNPITHQVDSKPIANEIHCVPVIVVAA